MSRILHPYSPSETAAALAASCLVSPGPHGTSIGTWASVFCLSQSWLIYWSIRIHCALVFIMGSCLRELEQDGNVLSWAFLCGEGDVFEGFASLPGVRQLQDKSRHCVLAYYNVSPNSFVTNDHLCRVSLCIRRQYVLQPHSTDIGRSGGGNMEDERKD